MEIKSLIIWISVTLVLTLLAFLGKKYFLSIARFEKRKSLIQWGMAVIVIATSTFLFAVLFPLKSDELKAEYKSEITDSSSSENITQKGSMQEPMATDINGNEIYDGSTYLYQVGLSKFYAIAGSVLVLILVILMILLSRQDEKKEENEYERKKLFEYKEETFHEINLKGKIQE